MIFASHVFLYGFLPAFLLLYHLMPRGGRNLVVALASYVFYGWWRPDFVVLMWISTIVDYVCGRQIEAAREVGRRGSRWLALSMVTNLGMLGWFKYANFGVATLNALLQAQGVEPMAWTEVVLPIGISFYTFQTMSYTIDVFRGAAPRVRRFGDFMCYVAMFPQLVAGPIVRYRDVADQLRERHVGLTRFFQGVLLFQCGLAKKILFADVLAPLADGAFAADTLSAGHAWLGLLAFTFQIYFDFSGYSDMAIGLGMMIGFRLPVNFDAPYRSRSITEFWRRWHISLSSWLRDYLYVPLGGNRKGPRRTYVNLGLTMLLGGLWHGAAWSFIAWGAWQGAWLIAERLRGRRAFYAAVPGPVAVMFTFVITMAGWVFFKASDVGAAITYFGRLAGMGEGGAELIGITMLQILVLALAILMTFAGRTSQELSARGRLPWVLLLQLLFVLAVCHLHYQSHVPFLYYRF